MSWAKKIGRLRVIVAEEGMLNQEYCHGARVECIDGWNDDCLTVAHVVSVDELRDLHYAVGRAIAAADEALAQHRARR